MVTGGPEGGQGLDGTGRLGLVNCHWLHWVEGTGRMWRLTGAVGGTGEDNDAQDSGLGNPRDGGILTQVQTGGGGTEHSALSTGST